MVETVSNVTSHYHPFIVSFCWTQYLNVIRIRYNDQSPAWERRSKVKQLQNIVGGWGVGWGAVMVNTSSISINVRMDINHHVAVDSIQIQITGGEAWY